MPVVRANDTGGTEVSPPAGTPREGSVSPNSVELEAPEAMATARRVGIIAVLPARMRRQLRPKLWQEIAFILLSYWVYSLIRNAVPTHEKPALLRGRHILYAENHT